jgi:sulfatase maturation enzyme AslB (radical SAM superfamily)
MEPPVIDAMLEWCVDWVMEHSTMQDKKADFTWYGGEPLTNFKLMKYAVPRIYQTFTVKGIPNSQSVTTNGSLIDQEVMDFLLLYNMGMLLSIDGPPWIHNKQRTYYEGRPTWDDIDTKLILKHMPNVEIAWQLDPDLAVTMEDVEWMIQRGFHRINFNINSIKEWTGDQQLWLTKLMKDVGRACIQTEQGVRPKEEALLSNAWHKFKQGVSIWADPKNEEKTRGEKPCGTSINMLAISPEGWLYPSQEMVFNTAEPGKAPGTMEYYKVGDVFKSPVLDKAAMERAFDIYVKQMEEPKELGFDCTNCVNRPLSFGGCHCRYVGQDGVDPAHRFTVTPGWCQKGEAFWNGLMQAAMIEGLFTMKGMNTHGNKRKHQRNPRPGIHGTVCQPLQ